MGPLELTLQAIVYLPCWCWDMNPGPLIGPQVLLTVESCLSTPILSDLEGVGGGEGCFYPVTIKLLSLALPLGSITLCKISEEFYFPASASSSIKWDHSSTYIMELFDRQFNLVI